MQPVGVIYLPHAIEPETFCDILHLCFRVCALARRKHSLECGARGSDLGFVARENKDLLAGNFSLILDRFCNYVQTASTAFLSLRMRKLLYHFIAHTVKLYLLQNYHFRDTYNKHSTYAATEPFYHARPYFTVKFYLSLAFTDYCCDVVMAV